MNIARVTRRAVLAGIAAPMIARAADPPIKESITSGPTFDRTPQIGIVRSDLKDGAEEDGTPFRGLPERRPLNATLSMAHVHAMVYKAIEFGGLRRGGLHTVIGPDEWVVILTGRDTDPRVTRALIAYLKEKRRAARLTMLDPPAIARAERVELPVPMHFSRSCSIPKILQNCDRLIAVASLESLAIGNYSCMGTSGMDDEALADLVEFHRPDYAVVSGTGERRNIVFAGVNAVAVDAVAGAAMGRPARYLQTMHRRGFGMMDPDAIWIRGNTLDEAKEAFAQKGIGS